MPDSLAGILIAIAVVLPGFVIAELSTVGRPAAKRSDLEIVLRALFYAFLLHLCAGQYTRWLVERVDSLNGWKDHLCAISVYAFLILVLVPVVVGVSLNAYFRTVERRPKPPGRFYEFLGARDSGCAADLLFTRLYKGAWLIVQLVDGSYVGGRFGERSMAGQSPDEHDLYIDEMWEVDSTTGPDPILTGALSPQRGIYLPAVQIRSVRVESPSG
jgi:hypothetical protein